MKTFKTYMLLAISFMAFNALLAQDKWAVELRPVVNFATKDLQNTDLKTGFGFEANIAYNFMEHLGAYVGWGYNTFNADDSFAGVDTDFDETGYTFGLQFIHPINNSSVSYLIRAGGIYNHIEVENSAGSITADSGHGLGWELGAGIDTDLGGNWSLRPQLGFRSLSRDIQIGESTIAVDLNYIALGVGVVKVF